MGVYIIMPCLLKEAKEKVYLTEVLLPFTHQNNLKVGLDTKDKIITEYHQIAKDNPGIASWIQLMSYSPTSFEKISIPNNDIDTTEVEYYLLVCKHVTQQKKVIAFSYQSFYNYPFKESNKICYEGFDMNVYDRDDAIEELKCFNNNNIIINDSIIATNGSSINKVKL
jgi:hypothetical protein